MYQLEVKAALVAARFHPASGWSVSVDVDAMERGNGGKHPEGKRERAAVAEIKLRTMGARIGKHPQFGRTDIVAEHPHLGTVVVEVEGTSRRQPEQALYSALGQTLLMMRSFDEGVTYAVAVPDEEIWVRHVRKIPRIAAERLRLDVYLVGNASVRLWVDDGPFS